MLELNQTYLTRAGHSVRVDGFRDGWVQGTFLASGLHAGWNFDGTYMWPGNEHEHDLVSNEDDESVFVESVSWPKWLAIIAGAAAASMLLSFSFPWGG